MKTMNAIREFGTQLIDTLNKPHETALSLVSDLVQAAVATIGTLDRDNPKLEEKLRARISECLKTRMAAVQLNLARSPDAELAAEAVRLRQLACVVAFTKDVAALTYLAGNLEVQDGRLDYLPTEASQLDDDDDESDAEAEVVDALLAGCGPVALAPPIVCERTADGWNLKVTGEILTLPRPEACPPGHAIFITNQQGQTTVRPPTPAEVMERLAIERGEAQFRVRIVENRTPFSVGTSIASTLLPHPDTLRLDAPAIRVPLFLGDNDYAGALVLSRGVIDVEFTTKPGALLWLQGGGVRSFDGSIRAKIGDVIQVGRFDIHLEAITKAS